MERVRRGRRRRKKYPTGFLCPNHSDKPLRAKIVSAMASTIFESYLHCLEWNWNVLFCSLGRSTLLVVTVAPVRSFLPNIRTVKTQNGFVDPVTPLLFSEIKTISVYR